MQSPHLTKGGNPWMCGQITEKNDNRSYTLKTPIRTIRRNRIHLRAAAAPSIPLQHKVVYVNKPSINNSSNNTDCKNIEMMHTPQVIRANNAPFMTKELCKAFMVRSRLRNKYMEIKTAESREAYKKQRNYCTYLLRKTKKSYYENLNVNLITDNKTFWKYTKPLFSDKSPTTSNIVLLEGNKMFTDSAKCAEILNNFFSDAAINLEIDRTLHTLVSNASDPVTIAIERYKNHPSIIKLNQDCFPKFSFDFQHIFETDILLVIENLDSSKAFQKDNIPPKILKDNKDICSTFLTNDVNRCIGNGKFPLNLKYADITPLFKKHIGRKNQIIDLLVSYLRSLKVMKNYFLLKFIVFSTGFFQNIYVDLEKGIVSNIVCYTC